MSTWIIGDIQGCYDEFRNLLDKCDFDPAEDTLWLVGDLVNRGPNNIDVLRYVMTLDNVTTVLGNHDLHFLAVARGFTEQRTKDTLDDLLASPILGDICEWIRTRPMIHVDDAHRIVMVHAGLPPQWDIATCRQRARELESVLRGANLDEFLAGMYGNEPILWADDLAGSERLRLITNYFTRLRFCKADGTIELQSKETESPAGYSPWFSFPRDDDYTIVFGHWAALEGRIDSPHAIGLDTGCVWGHRLTALRLEDRARVAVPARKQYQPF